MEITNDEIDNFQDWLTLMILKELQDENPKIRELLNKENERNDKN